MVKRIIFSMAFATLVNIGLINTSSAIIVNCPTTVTSTLLEQTYDPDATDPTGAGSNYELTVPDNKQYNISWSGISGVADIGPLNSANGFYDNEKELYRISCTYGYEGSPPAYLYGDSATLFKEINVTTAPAPKLEESND